MDANLRLVEFLQADATAKTAAFSAKLAPTVAPERFLGVKSAPIKAAAKALLKGQLPVTAADFLAAAPHPYVELDLIHIHVLNAVRELDKWQQYCTDFLPYLDNWMVTDALDPSFLHGKKSVGSVAAAQVLAIASDWLQAKETYTVRAGVIIFLQALAKGHFAPEQLTQVAAVRHEDYYVHMAVGWYFATAFDKQEELTRPFLEEPGHLQLAAHRLAIRKIIESRRTSAENLLWAKQKRTELNVLARR